MSPSTRPRRLEQARSIAAIVQERLDDDPAAQVIVLGDLNDFYDGPAPRTADCSAAWSG